MLSASSNYLFVPLNGQATQGRLYELGPAGGYRPDSLVLIPYRDPQLSPPEPQFYPVLKVSEPYELAAGASNPGLMLKARTDKEHYIQNVKALKEQIGLGNIYEINYCVEFFAEHAEIDPEAVFAKLCALAKAPYSGLLKLGGEYILCASPELFLKKEGALMSSKPIKGTARRGQNPVEDEALKSALYNSLKERTENVMAVDVARNDLSRFATRGSVAVNRLYNIETFETVHQMVSTVSCEIQAGTTFEQMMDATFPMASMTGAPKISAMQLIGRFEDFERKNYSGAMGIIDANEDFTLSVIIRSIFYNRQTKRLSIAVGGAITHLSDPEQEYEECLLKANALLKALNATIG